MPVPLVIVGAGGHAREVHDVVEALNDHGGAFDFVGFVDDRPPDPSSLQERGPYLGPVRALETLPAGVQYVVAFGDGALRRRFDRIAAAAGLAAATLVHPRATVGRHAVRLAPGVVVCAHASITTDVTVGRHVHLNVGAAVAHDCVLGDYVTINPGARVSGRVTLEEGVTVGAGATIIQNVQVGRATTVGAGAVVVRDLPPAVTAVGVPARPLDDAPPTTGRPAAT